MKLTRTQQCLADVLADGLPHNRHDLRRCLYDDQGALSNLRYHICQLRKILRTEGREIICELSGGRICYRLIPLPNACV